ncbi:MAG: cytochrome C oxidase subunit IV family protein [Phycisphaerales bacterium]
MAHHAPAPTAEFNELDPHGAGSHGQHASHVIVSPLQLRAVLAILLFFTFLTVGFAWAEQWAVDTFHLTLPWWVNVYGAMGIAVVKALFVMAVFMQLKYDNPMNSIIMAFTFAALAVFIAFTGIDLFNRGAVITWKAGPVHPGGTGDLVSYPYGPPAAAGTNVVDAAKQRHLKKLEERLGSPQAAMLEFERQRAENSHAPHDTHSEHAGNSASRTRPRVGRTDALEAGAKPAAPADHGHH